MTELQNSAFKEKASRVEDVSKILPEVGAVVLNNLDGRLYAADKFGWHRFGDPYSPLTLFINFDGTNQFLFRFKAPSTSTLTIHNGDGTVTEVAGNDATEVEHLTTYAAAGQYYFSVAGDIKDLTAINLFLQTMATGHVTGWEQLTSLEDISIGFANMSGDISDFNVLTSLTRLNVGVTSVTGSIDKFGSLVNMEQLYINTVEVDGNIGVCALMTSLAFCNCFESNISGDVSELSGLSLTQLNMQLSKADFDKVDQLDVSSALRLDDCNLTPSEVDNALNSMVNLTGVTINLGGNNAPRTSASDAAFATVDAANTLTVN